MDDSATLLLDQMPARYAACIAAQQQSLQSCSREVPPYNIDQRGLPVPVWVRRGLPEDGPHAWETLRAELQAAPAQRPYCMYIHVPFCDSHCEFCDCYAFALRRQQEARTKSYTDLLLQEIDLWSGQGNLARRPVTTVHLGGGTPTMLGQQRLADLVGALRTRFAIDAGTEWALETTSSSLDEGMFAALHELGFTRLHIGVQSLQDEVRSAIGRRESGSAVIGKIEKALSLGWTVSVDEIVGLPAQTPSGLTADLDRLLAVGVEGFSIYELQHSQRNRRFFEQHHLNSQPPARNYLLFQLAFHHLRERGLRLNVFNHFAKGRDRNLYFTFPKRNEDLLALGTIADGVFGNYHYRHPEYLKYTKAVAPNSPGLQGGLRRTMFEDGMHRLEVEVMSGRIDPSIFSGVLGEELTDRLIHRWLAHQMIEMGPQQAGYALMPNGSWFTGRLLQECYACA